jgi:hypothetical protein
MNRIISWFSNGAASAVAGKLAIRFFHPHPVEIVCCDTRPSEHPDNYRFSAECEKWFGQKIIYLKNTKFETVDDVFREHQYMSGIKGATCTTQLKKLPRREYQAPDDLHIFGFTIDEGRRIIQFRNNNPELKLFFILAAAWFTKADCFEQLRAAGIGLPAMYQLGFDNNNCPGCVKASSPWYWSMVREKFPEVFKRRCEQSRQLGVRLVEISRHKRIFLDELPQREFKKKNENLSCGPECGVPQVL